jgi:hypothetical protein
MKVAMNRLAGVCIAAAGLVLAGCSSEPQQTRGSSKIAPAAAAASIDAAGGQIRGTDVHLTASEFDGELAIYEGDGWGWNPSMLIFLFLDEDEIPENRTFHVSAEAGMEASSPHIHYRWRDPQSGDIEVEVTVQGYDMTLAFGTVEGDALPGTIDFALPEENTRITGEFRAKIKRQNNR